MNIITIIGRLTDNVELKQTQSGKSVVTVNVAVDRPFAKDVTDFFTVIFWNQQAEYISRYAQKGSKVAISGILTTRAWQDKNGNKRTAYEIIANTVELCESKRENATEGKISHFRGGEEIEY
jgi:single-strand DNA-binding protein